MPSPILGNALEGLLITPILGADFKSFEELKWIINTNVLSGIEWSMEGSTRRFRVLFNYYHGFAPMGSSSRRKWSGSASGCTYRFDQGPLVRIGEHT